MVMISRGQGVNKSCLSSALSTVHDFTLQLYRLRRRCENTTLLFNFPNSHCRRTMNIYVVAFTAKGKTRSGAL